MYRLFKRLDGSVIQAHYTKPVQQVKFPAYTDGLPYVDVADSSFTPSNSEDGRYLEMFYFDGECSLENLKLDAQWQVQLMPACVVQDKREKRLSRAIVEALKNAVVDAKEMAQLMYLWVQARSLPDAEEVWGWALDGLDARVKNGEPDKPKIREQLQAKLQQLNSAQAEGKDGAYGQESEHEAGVVHVERRGVDGH